MDAKLRQRHRKIRVSRKIKRVTTVPRLHIFRSNQHIYAQVIDLTGTIKAAASDQKMTGTKTEKAVKVGEAVAQAALKQKVTKVAFDRGSYRYHGRVKAVADAARAAGLQF